MSGGTIRGIVTALLIVAFVGICIWAYSKRRKPQFDAAARLPLEEDSDRAPSEKKR